MSSGAAADCLLHWGVGPRSFITAVSPTCRVHTFLPEAQLRRGVLNVVVVKDPYFWAASMRRNPHQAPLDTSDLSAPFRYQGRSVRGVAHYWNIFTGNYASRFAVANTLVFRSSDLLFRWAEVVATLRQALPARPGADFSEAARLQHVATKENARSRGLSEARGFYAEPRNRVKGFSEVELRYMAAELDPALMARWGYRHPWGPTPPLARLDRHN